MLLRAFVLLVLCRFVIDGDKPEDRKLSTSGHDPKLDFKLHETIKYTDNKGKSLCLPIPVSFNNYNEVSSFHYDIVRSVVTKLAANVLCILIKLHKTNLVMSL
jgi:hypothetical protein